MSNYDVIVIGAGNAGLSTAATLAKSKKKVLVLEKHNIPGGCGTSFRRGRFEFEVALHQLSQMGSSQKPGPLREIFRDLGIEDEIDWIEIDSLYRVILPGKIDLALPADKQKCIDVLSRRFPEEKEQIIKYYDLIWKLCDEYFSLLSAQKKKNKTTVFSNTTKKILAGALFGKKFPLLKKYSLKTAQEVLDEFFTNKQLQMCLNVYWTFMGMPPNRLPFTILAACTYIYINDKPYYLKGTSQVMSQALTEAIIKNGGEVRFNCEVKRIILEDKKACGVITDSGEEIRAKKIVSNISPIHTYVNLLEPEDVPKNAIEYLRSYNVGVSSITCFIGLDCPPEDVGFKSSFNLIYPNVNVNEGFINASKLMVEDDPMVVTCYTVDDPSISPKGTSVVSAVTLKYAEPWITLSPEQYYETKYKCGEKMVERMNAQFPGLRDHIEEMEIATPLTYIHYLNHPGGAIYGFEQDVKSTGFFYPNESQIKNLVFASGWARICGFGPNYLLGNKIAHGLINEEE